MTHGKENTSLFSSITHVENGKERAAASLFSLPASNRSNEQTVPKLNSSSWDVVRDFTKPNIHSSETYLNYSDRIATFKTWPRAMPITSMEFAHAGFIYTGFGDKVHCPWCKITLHEFEGRDSAYEEHLKHSRGCGYLRMTLPANVTDLSKPLRGKLFSPF